MTSPRRSVVRTLLLTLPTVPLVVTIATAARAQAQNPAPAPAPGASSAPPASPPAVPSGATTPPAAPSSTAPAPLAPPPPPAEAAPTPPAAPPTPATPAAPEAPAPAAPYAPALGPAMIVAPMRGRVILSAERLAGVTATSSSASTTTTFTSSGSSTLNGVVVKQNLDVSSTSVNLLWNGGASNVFAIPRLAVDGFVAPQVTLGGSAGYLSRSGSTKTASVTSVPGDSPTSTNNDDDLPDVSAFVVSPRLGVVLALGPSVALWVRGGITYYQASSDSTATTHPASSSSTTITTKVSAESSGTAVTLDAQLVIVPIEHVGITLGPVFDIGLGGSTKTTTTTTTSSGSSSPGTQTTVQDGDLTENNYGVAAGIVAFF